MYLGIESMYESSKMLLDYMTHLYSFNAFLLDEVDENKVKLLKIAIEKEDKIKAIRLYSRLDKEIDMVRDKHCYNNSELPYRSSFRNIAKDLYRELKIRDLTHTDDLKCVSYILRFISTSDYYIIREMLIKRSLSFYMYQDVPINPESFYCNYIPIEAIMDYCVKMATLYIKWND